MRRFFLNVMIKYLHKLYDLYIQSNSRMNGSKILNKTFTCSLNFKSLHFDTVNKLYTFQ